LKTDWDYTSQAASYDNRADYSSLGIQQLLTFLGLSAGNRVADIGAGTGKLTLAFSAHGLQVTAIEPNKAMRRFGMQNTRQYNIEWVTGVAEQLPVNSNHYHLAAFGSSFNVVDQPLALREAARVLYPNASFTCLWNHRDLNDPIQREMEKIIHKDLPGFSYGNRREDQSKTIIECGLFKPPELIESTFVTTMSVDQYMSAWQSHATLARAAGSRFETIIRKMKQQLNGMQDLHTPYTTRIWYAQKK